MDNNDNNQLSQITTTNLLPSDDEIDYYWSTLLNSPTVGLISNNDGQMVIPVGNDQCSTSTTTTSTNSLLPSEIINKERSINYEEEEAVVREDCCCVDNKVDDKGKGLSSTSMSTRTRKAKSVPRFEFRTRSSEDILDDGFRWRKYGQKSVKNNIYPRSYYRCTHLTCNVKKQVQRLSKDPGIVVTTYEGIHNHPCEKLMEALSPLLNQMQFLSRLG